MRAIAAHFPIQHRGWSSHNMIPKFYLILNSPITLFIPTAFHNIQSPIFPFTVVCIEWSRDLVFIHAIKAPTHCWCYTNNNQQLWAQPTGCVYRCTFLWVQRVLMQFYQSAHCTQFGRVDKDLSKSCFLSHTVIGKSSKL